ncbi:Porin [Granulibacter bethesdensis]|uniref:Porin n=2 Tax=Granulibacter bethesdensis TaxID=364410 RepID=A0AAN0VF49_9PROT|nr:Porin [Granulibacter bethesdensis]
MSRFYFAFFFLIAALLAPLPSTASPPAKPGTPNRDPWRVQENSVDDIVMDVSRLGIDATPPNLPDHVSLANGVNFIAAYTAEMASNPVGGIKQEAAYAGQILVGADFDMNKLARLNGVSVHLAITNRQGRSLSRDAIGNSTSVQEIWGGGQTTRLTQLTIEKKAFNDRLLLEAGRGIANPEFLSSPLYCQFQSNSVCGSPTFVFRTSSLTWWPASSWMGRVKVWMTPRIYLHAGAYEVNRSFQGNNDHGLNWSTNRANGVIVPFELGYATTFENDRLPRHYQIGGWYDATHYDDPSRDIQGGYVQVSGLPAQSLYGRSGAYIRFDQMVWRPGHSQRGLTVFGVAMTGISGRLGEDYFLEAGMVMTAPFKKRPYDTMGFMINNQSLSGAALQGVSEARTLAGLSPETNRNQIMMELNYTFQALGTVRITPNLQYIVNPDQLRYPTRPKSIPDAFVIGMKLTVSIANLVDNMIKGHPF